MPRHCRDCRAWNPSPDDPLEGTCAYLPRDDAGQWSGEPLSGKIGLQVVFYFTPPKRARAAQRAAMLADEEYPRIAQQKLDKYLRIVVDSLVGTVCTEEKQIVLMTARAAYGETEHGVVEVGRVLFAADIAA